MNPLIEVHPAMIKYLLSMNAYKTMSITISCSKIYFQLFQPIHWFFFYPALLFQWLLQQIMMFFEFLVIVFLSFDRFGLHRKHLLLDIAALISTVCCFLSLCPLIPNDPQFICMLLKVLQIWVFKSDHAVLSLSMRKIISHLLRNYKIKKF